MTYEELWLNATYLLDHNKITLGEFEEMIEPLKHEISEQTEPQTDYKMPYEDCEDCETHLKAQMQARKTEPQTEREDE